MIESAKYTQSGDILAVIDGVEMVVPDDMANRHRQMIAAWEAEGNTIAPFDGPAPPSDLTELDQRILAAPDTLFGGPTLKEVFDVHATGD